MKITPEEALQRIPVMKKTKGTSGSTSNIIEFVKPIGETNSLYLFKQGNDIIITTSDSDLNPIIGQCEDVNIDDIPPSLKAWMEEYSEEVEWYQRVGHTLPDEGMATTQTRKTIPILINNKWGQGAPYNSKLKFPDGKTSVVGCAALAIGQLIYYWGTKGYHRGCMKTKAYKTNKNNYDIASLNPITVFDYAHFTSGKPTTEESINAIATMLEYVGKALNSDYTPGGTSVYTSLIAPIMSTYLRMGEVKEVYIGYTTALNFENTVYKELEAGRPVILFGTGSDGGHFFVCDGYDADTGKFHFNWGWNGNYNGWFAMSALNPQTYQFNSRKRAYIGINPGYKLGDATKDGDVNVADVTQIVDNTLKNKYTPESDVNSDGETTITDVQLVIDHILGIKKL